MDAALKAAVRMVTPFAVSVTSPTPKTPAETVADRFNGTGALPDTVMSGPELMSGMFVKTAFGL